MLKGVSKGSRRDRQMRSAEPSVAAPSNSATSSSFGEILEHGYDDALTDVTRAERRMLLATNAALVMLIWGSLVPTKIAAFGVELAAPGRYTIIVVAFAINLYFLAAFWLYARVDDRVWHLAYVEAESRTWEAFSKPDPEGKGGAITMGGDAPPEERHFDPEIFFRAWKISQKVYFRRRWFDIQMPIVLTALVWVGCCAKLFVNGL